MYRARVFLASTDVELRRRLRALLPKEGYQVVGEADSGAEALRRIRAVPPELVVLDDELPGGLEVLRVVTDDRLGAVVLLTSVWQRDLGARLAGSGLVGFALKPVRSATLLPALETCLAAYRRVTALEEEVGRLKERLETRKVVEKAKGILMQTLGLTEQEAYRRIQKESMDRCTSMRAIADAIILAHELRNK
ncbi:MAG: ANTAR domain-containing protein [Clostridia bacterium]|nr:ANTAR domain-containing protein [Clostridia bacterium]